MEAPSSDVMLARVRALPGAAPLLARRDHLPVIYLVGGAVRDLLLGQTSGDLDLLVETDPAVVAERLGGKLTVHDRFGTATVELEGRTYDIARARTESYAEPGALPDVEPATIDADLPRRDFTVNAVAVPLGGPHAGELHAVDGALGDLAARRLRVLHDRSFIDDPTRLLRLARYASRLGFEIEAGTLALARAAVAAGALGTVSGPRIGAELRLLAREPNPVSAFASLRALDLDAAIAEGFGIGDAALAERALALLPADGRPDLLVLALAARAVPQRELAQQLERLAFEASDRDAILAAAGRAEHLAEGLAEADRPSLLAASAAGAGPELVAVAGALGPADAAREWLERTRHVRLEIDGADLLAAGVPEGPAIGRGLRAALAAKLDGRVSGREAELAQALAAARG